MQGIPPAPTREAHQGGRPDVNDRPWVAEFVTDVSVRQLLDIPSDDLDGALQVGQPVRPGPGTFVDVHHLRDDLRRQHTDHRKDAERDEHLDEREPGGRGGARAVTALPASAHQYCPMKAVMPSTGPTSSPSSMANTVYCTRRNQG